jgi:2-methylcitrate dehydratase PrpD
MSDHSATDNVHTRRIADFVSQLRYEQIPESVRRAGKAPDPRLARLRDLRRQARMVPHPAEDASAIGRSARPRSGARGRLSSTNAALVNGTQVQGFELDDVHRRGVLHCGAVTLPALIAVRRAMPP